MYYSKIQCEKYQTKVHLKDIYIKILYKFHLQKSIWHDCL